MKIYNKKKISWDYLSRWFIDDLWFSAMKAQKVEFYIIDRNNKSETQTQILNLGVVVSWRSGTIIKKTTVLTHLHAQKLKESFDSLPDMILKVNKVNSLR